MQRGFFLPVNTILKGTSYNYEILKVLGQGSFGITYLASVKMAGALGAIDANIKVAIKEFFMRDINGRSDATVTSGSKGGIYDEYKRKFTREALNLSKLQHPNIIKVIESFEANNTVYYVMEYINGGSLDDYITKNNGLKEDEAIKIVKQIASALSFMHKNKMLHLDLKPSNIMRKESGDNVLIDFGLSKQYDKNGEPESSTKVGAGTPGYAPIEQANYREGKGFPVTMDVYALGATMFKILTGVRPPEASDILNDGFPLYELQEHGISERISASIAKAMAPTKKDRYDSVSRFIDSFEEDVTVIDVDVAAGRNSHKGHKTENVFQVRPNTSKVTFEFHPRTPMLHGSYFCSVDKKMGVDTNITQETTHNGCRLNEQEYDMFLRKLQSLNLKIRDKEVPPYKELEYSENPAKLTITLYDENYRVYNRLWISGWKNELGNIEGNIHEIEEQVRKIVPMLQEYIDGPYYEIPNLYRKFKEKNKNADIGNDVKTKSSDITLLHNSAQGGKPLIKWILGGLCVIACSFLLYYALSRCSGNALEGEDMPISLPVVSDTTFVSIEEKSPKIPTNFVLVSGGKNKSNVHIDSFYIDKYELTQGEYRRVIGNLEKKNYLYPTTWNSEKQEYNQEEFLGDSLPVLGTYKQLALYCQKRSVNEGYDGFYDINGNTIKLIHNGNGYRLVTAHEWAFAAKGGVEREHFKYIGGNKLGDVAWFGGNSGGKPHNVGLKKANKLGLYDMVGNIREALEDFSGLDYITYGDYAYWVGFDDDVVGGVYKRKAEGDIEGTRIVLVPKTMKNNNTKLRW